MNADAGYANLGGNDQHMEDTEESSEEEMDDVDDGDDDFDEDSEDYEGEEDDMEEDNNVIAHYDAQRCAALLEALRHNDLSVTEVIAWRVQPGRHNELYEALNRNTVVTSLCICGSVCLRLAALEIESMISYIQASKALVKVKLVSHEEPETLNPVLAEIASRVIDAILANPRIVTFHHECATPPHILAHLLRETRALRDLELCTDEFVDPTTLQVLAASFSVNQSLERLKLHAQFETDVVVPILRNLCSHRRLRELDLSLHADDGTVERSEALASLLCSAAPLQAVTLKFYNLNSTHFDIVFPALQRSNQHRSLTKLTLWFCKFDEESTENLVRFFQRSANKGSNTIRELHLWMSDMFGERGDGNIAAEMLIGSSLDVFRISDQSPGEGSTTIEDFLNGLQRTSSRILVPSLNIEFLMNRWEFAALVSFLPTSDHLRHLFVVGFQYDADQAAFLNALRTNTSLFDVVMDDPDFWTSPMPRLAQAICIRNQKLPSLMEVPLVPDDEYREAGYIKLFPALCACAQQAPRTGTNNFFAGLVTNPGLGG